MTATPLTLHVRCRDGSVVDGQSIIMRTADIERVWITPDGVDASGTRWPPSPTPSSSCWAPDLCTSLLPSLLLPSIRDASSSATAPRLYVCNVATQHGETTGLDLSPSSRR